MPLRRGMRAARLAIFGAFVSVPSLAWAETEPPLLDLAWEAPKECPAKDAVVARVEELVGPRRPDLKTLRAQARVTKSADPSQPRYVLELFVDGAESPSRTFRGEDCSHTVDAAAIVLALDIDREAAAHVEPVPPPPTAEGSVGSDSTPLPSSAKPAPKAAAEARSRHVPSRYRVEAGLRFVFDDGSLPRATMGLAAAVALARGPLMLELQGTVYDDKFTSGGPRGGVGGADVALSTLGAHACWRGMLVTASFRACAGGELGVESTTGVSVTYPLKASGLWSAASVMLATRILPGRRISPTAGVALVHPIGAPDVFIEGFGRIFEPSFLAVRCFLGVDVLFF